MTKESLLEIHSTEDPANVYITVLSLRILFNWYYNYENPSPWLVVNQPAICGVAMGV